MVEVRLGHRAAAAPRRYAARRLGRVAARRGAGKAVACRRRFELEGDEPERVADIDASPEGISRRAARCVAEVSLRIAVGA